MSSTKWKLTRYKSGGLDIAVESKGSGRETKKDFRQYDRTSTRLTCWVDMPSGKVITGLTKEDEKYFVEQLGIDLVKYPQGLAPNSRYWSENGKFLTADGIHFDEENIEDVFWIKVYSARGDVALNSTEARNNAKTEYLLSCQDSEADAKIAKRDYLINAMTLLSSMSTEDMRNHLILVNQYSATFSDKVVKDKVGDLAESNPKMFIAVNQNPDKKELLFLQELINHRLIINSGATSVYTDATGNQIAYSKDQMIAWIKNSENNAAVVGLKKQLAAIKKSK